ncbi:CBS domain-containing protein [Streptomyces xanthii]|uniref:CBS domain-containing protein n=1 Tax=Streptomyces xanthii TaxID=2768069 RepID=A0A7H1B0Q4_9ACTN|nr:CBS domain-containing protein [Streptomyces xanthii]QNS02309.1 CBS domain-containing protein [Streptomyces xanthii]
MKHLKVGDLMQSDVVGARPGTSPGDVARLFTEHGISGLPVVDEDDHVVGVISRNDLTARPAGTVRDLMTVPAVTVHAQARAADAARLMVRRGVARLPVVDEEARLVGVVTSLDLLSVFLRPDSEIQHRIQNELLVGTLGLSPGMIDVHVLNGVVVLGGRIADRREGELLLRLAEGVEGVVSVVDRLTARDHGEELTSSGRAAREGST